MENIRRSNRIIPFTSIDIGVVLRGGDRHRVGGLVVGLLVRVRDRVRGCEQYPQNDSHCGRELSGTGYPGPRHFRFAAAAVKRGVAWRGSLALHRAISRIRPSSLLLALFSSRSFHPRNTTRHGHVHQPREEHATGWSAVRIGQPRMFIAVFRFCVQRHV